MGVVRKLKNQDNDFIESEKNEDTFTYMLRPLFRLSRENFKGAGHGCNGLFLSS